MKVGWLDESIGIKLPESILCVLDLHLRLPSVFVARMESRIPEIACWMLSLHVIQIVIHSRIIFTIFRSNTKSPLGRIGGN